MNMTREEIEKKYPDININDRGGTDSFQEGVEIIERDPIAVVLKHPTENMFLMAKWKQSEWNGFITGGIEEGDTVEDTIRNEVREESGYLNVGKITKTDEVSHGLFYHVIKGVNRLAHYHLVMAELENLEQEEVSEEEKAIADFVWVPEEEVADMITENDMKHLWEQYQKLTRSAA